jgi:hypothetical protein
MARQAARASCKPWLEVLEDRTVPATFTPTTFADGTGPGTLRNAILQANSNNQDNTILLASGTYTLTPAAGGELALTGAGHALTIQGTGQTILSAGSSSRVLEVIGNVQLILASLTIGNGLATDSGSIGGADARGGGLLLNGGSATLNAVVVSGNMAQAGPGDSAFGGGIYANVATLTLVNSTITGNQARAGAGAAGGAGGSGQAGAPGQGGGAAQGGGLYVAGGSLSISGSTISANLAVGGNGGAGGQGGARIVPSPTVQPHQQFRRRLGFFGSTGFLPFGPYGYGPYSYGPTGGTTAGTPGPGFTGGPTIAASFGGPTGGTGFGSGGFGSGGGSGGGSGSLQAAAPGNRGGDGGMGGVGGRGQGGGLYVAGGMVNLASVTLSANRTQGGSGGRGGDPGTGSPDGTGGSGGNAGLSQGAGIYIASGTVSLTNVVFSENQAQDSPGGPAGATGSGVPVNGMTEVGQGNRVFRAGGGLDAPVSVSALDTVGAFDPRTATWYLRNDYGPGAPNVGTFVYGGRDWNPVVGDWNGDGSMTVGVVSPSAVWYLRNESSPGAPDITPFAYGEPGWIPVVGDWNGTGHTGIGMFDPTTATWYLRNEDSPGPPDAGVFRYGSPGWRPVVGDWRGNGVSTIGVVDPATETWYLRDSNSAGAATLPPFRFGSPGWDPVVGDWMNMGTTTVGVVDPNTGTWYLRNENNPGPADAGSFAYGAAHWRYLAGHWNPSPGPPQGQPELAAGGTVTADPATGSLTEQQLQAVVVAALVRLKDAGVGPGLLARLGSVTYEVGQLSGPTLGYAYAKAHTVVIDTSAAGYGWFVDPTPLTDEEFARAAGELTALPNGPAEGRMDLLTVVLHEMGHIAGRGDVSTASHPDYLMDDSLAPGVRRTEALDAVFSERGTG